MPAIADLHHQTRLYYTLIANCIRAGHINITKIDANSYVMRALEASCKLCKEEDSIVTMKLILKEGTRE